MVLHKCGEKLYTGVKGVITDHLKDETINKIVPAFSTSGNSNGGISTSGISGITSLKTLNAVWAEHVTCMRMIRDILLYMDRIYSAKTPDCPPVYDLGLYLFRDEVLRSPKFSIQSQLVTVVLQQIQREREGEMIDRGVIKTTIDMLLDLADDGNSLLTVYQVDFESKFLESSTQFYRVEGQTLIGTCDSPEYLKKAEKRLTEEEQRSQHYLYSGTEPKIRSIIEKEMLENHIKTIIEMENSGLVAMLMNNKNEDILRMYKLLARIQSGHVEMKTSINQYIKKLGDTINSNCEAVETPSSTGKGPGSNAATSTALRWVQDVLDLKDKFDEVLEQATGKDKQFQIAINNAFESFINSNQKSPEYLSLFIDENLKKGLKGKSEEEIDLLLDKTISVFRFIEEKDVFERYYKQHLAKRLLTGRSVSDDAERGMISKLKIECGYQFTTKLEGMFNDMRLTTDTMSDFKEYINNLTENEGMPIELHVSVLTSTFWPVNTSSASCMLPPEVMAACQTFENFYLGRHSGRRLTWQTNLGSADIRAQFKTKKHELNVSTYQMVILMLFNDVEEGGHLTYQQIKSDTEIPENELKRHLQSLACAKYKILLKEPKSREIHETDRFMFNSEFSAPLARIKIQTIASKAENDGERRETRERVDEDRKHQIEAAAVRIMKDRKTMEHNNLISEVTRQLSSRFLPNPMDIKKRIEALIEREYLERSEDDRKIYNYLA
ncbi:Cullin-domain-containing protein [Basidiobolus meristosporus CBS 931.73]|uniref:Cullin-domain-containing protein n=1 Tax=Basidiobolus meristosporus CBS 931.73 TaxID=1314790 RepID=A0A1Y1YDU6_9FUNG|nr:Cullin-domain-containing protein [Basidiobolus meristosporus CBS 931.73]|eukprot:ORX96190.1 Cullin-domain-containing protein [Basidiobolus meristosporus CBS 931.73]